MLPRHLRSLALSRRGPAARGLLALSQPSGSHTSPFRISSAASRGRLVTAGFHSSSSRRNEGPKSPFQTFVDVLKDELRKNRELQDNVKQLQGDVDKLQDSEAMKKARAAYERARVRVSFLFIYFRDVKLVDILLADVKHQRESATESGS